MSDPAIDPRVARGMAAQLAARRARLDAGETAIGWKVGFGAPAALQKFALTGPLIGFLTDRGLMASGDTATLAGWVKPVAEPEIAVHIGHDLAPGGDRATAAAAIAALGPAIELADLDSPPEAVEPILAGNIFHRHVILGPRDASRAGARLDGLVGHVVRRGAAVARVTDLEANTGALVDIVRHVADVLGACGERLRAGDFIIAGSVVPPILLEPDEREIAFRLEPIGDVTVRLAGAKDD